MSINGSNIEWTDGTINFLTGCSPCGQGCLNCYAKRDSTRLSSNPNVKISAAYAGTVDDKGEWTGDINFIPERLEETANKTKGKRLFITSTSDPFHPNVKPEWQDALFKMMRRNASDCRKDRKRTPHIFQMLTKRFAAAHHYIKESDDTFREGGSTFAKRYPHLHLGFSAAVQNELEAAVGYLFKTPAAFRWLSLEPLVGQVSLLEALYKAQGSETSERVRNDGNVRVIDWVVVGGESMRPGHKARPCNLAWLERIVAECRVLRIPVFVKQLGSNPVDPGWYARDGYVDDGNKNHTFESFPRTLQFRELPACHAAYVDAASKKKRNDGRTLSTNM